jgi:hypothetical protein
MSTNETNNTNVEVVQDSLDDFAKELFGESESALGNAKPEESTEDDDTASNAPEEPEQVDTQSDESDDESEEVSEDDDTLAPETDDNEEDSDDGDKPRKKKNRFQERIDELTAGRREAERKAEAEEAARKALERRLENLENELKGNADKPKDEPSTAPTNNQSEIDPELKNPDGSKKYPLGRYDPQYLKDTVEAMFAAKEAEAQEKAQKSAEQRQREQAQMELQGEWNTKLETARERYPDFQEKGEQMLTVFEGIDEQYGEYLTNTLMEMDNGPDVFYYLSNNIDEAQEIVSAGPRKATIALAKLEAKIGGDGPKETPTKKVTKLKDPPPQNKGSSVSKPSIKPDTDDLSAFSRELFRKK